VGIVAATLGPINAASNTHFNTVLFSTHDSGRHWQRFPLSVNYYTETGTISFPDPRHGWLWYTGEPWAAWLSMCIVQLMVDATGGAWPAPRSRTPAPGTVAISRGLDWADTRRI
jgi:hypothetical protein